MRPDSKRRAVLVLALVGMILTAAVPARALYANKEYYWLPKTPGGPVLIPVCWENPSAAPAVRRGWARDAVESTWQRAARVNFVEWDSCKSGDPGVHILVTNESKFPGGVHLNKVTNGGKLDLAFANGPDGCRVSTRALRDCVMATTAHEFGHVLGFYHEEERPDYAPRPGRPTPACKKQTYDNPFPQYYGAYDVDSVMSYCGQPADHPETWKRSLSPNDVAAVQNAYGLRIPGTIVSTGGNCLAGHEASTKTETAFLWDCDEAKDDQEWRADSGALGPGFATTKLRLGTSRCLRGDASSHVAKLAACAGNASEYWSLTGFRIRGWGGLCLSAGGPLGSTVSMWTCNDSAGGAQRWNVTAGRIKRADDGRCLLGSKSGITLGKCPFLPLGQFRFFTSGELGFPGTDDCLDVQAPTEEQYRSGVGRPVNGMHVQEFRCIKTQQNQRWHATGPIRHLHTGLCLERGSEANGTPIRLASCDGRDAQEWDYYWTS